MATATEKQVEWITSGEARAILACSETCLAKMARTGLLTSRRVHGGWRRFVRAEVEQLARESKKYSGGDEA